MLAGQRGCCLRLLFTTLRRHVHLHIHNIEQKKNKRYLVSMHFFKANTPQLYQNVLYVKVLYAKVVAVVKS